MTQFSNIIKEYQGGGDQVRKGTLLPFLPKPQNIAIEGIFYTFTEIFVLLGKQILLLLKSSTG